MDCGYDVEAIGNDHPDMCCVVCLKLMREPVQFRCSHGICKPCYTNLNQAADSRHKKAQCPSCRKEIDDNQVFSNDMLHRMILSVRVKCSNAGCGCQWTGELINLENHVSHSCDYVRCGMQGCEAVVSRRVMDDHKQVCRYREITCCWCDLVYIFSEEKKHYEQCAKYPIPCPSMCGAEIMRCMMNEHATECQMSELPCPYSQYGCNIKILRKDIDKHLTTLVQYHLLLTTMKVTQKRNEEVEKLDSIREYMEERFGNIFSELESVKDRLLNLETMKKNEVADVKDTFRNIVVLYSRLVQYDHELIKYDNDVRLFTDKIDDMVDKMEKDSYQKFIVDDPDSKSEEMKALTEKLDNLNKAHSENAKSFRQEVENMRNNGYDCSQFPDRNGLNSLQWNFGVKVSALQDNLTTASDKYSKKIESVSGSVVGGVRIAAK